MSGIAFEQTKLGRAARTATALVCAYVLALTTILAAWSGNLAHPAGNLGVICSEHNAGAGDLPAGGGHGNHQLCAMLCNLLGAGIDTGVAPSVVALPRSIQPASAPVWAAQFEPQPIFLKDRPVRGPPPQAAA